MASTTDLLDHMEDIDDVLATKDISSTSGSLQDRAVRSLNRAQDLMEMVMAGFPDVFSEVDDTTTTTADQEYSDAPSGLKRVDSVWLLDSSTSRPKWEINAIRGSGSHRMDTPYPVFDTTTTTSGKPTAYWWERRNNRLYWDRDPDSSETIRVIGFYSADDMTVSPDSTFAYPDEFIIPVASAAVRVFQFRTDDDLQELQGFANAHFVPVIEQYRRAWVHQKGEIRGIFPAN